MASVEYKSYADNVKQALAEAIERAKLATAIMAKAEAVLLAPVAPLYGGTLRQSIDYDVLEDRVRIGSFANYAVYVEKGTGIYAEDGNGRQTPWVYYDPKTDQYYWTRGQSPQPFIMPAIMNHRDKITEIFAEELRKLEND